MAFLCVAGHDLGYQGQITSSSEHSLIRTALSTEIDFLRPFPEAKDLGTTGFVLYHDEGAWTLIQGH